MALLLTVERGDSVVMDNGIEIEVIRTGSKVQLAFKAPRSVEIHTVFADKTKQNKNKQADKRAFDRAQGLSVEQQRSKALQSLIRRNKNDQN